MRISDWSSDVCSSDLWDELTPARFAEVMAINVGGTFNACRAVMRQWRDAGMHGDIVNVSSLGGLRGMQRFSGFGAYATSKHAVVGLTEALALVGKPPGDRKSTRLNSSHKCASRMP